MDMPLHSVEKMHKPVPDHCRAAFHPCRTTRLPKNKGQGVVSPEFKVLGIKGLHVADESIISIIPDSHIQNSVYMVGEKPAGLIKSGHKDLYS